MSQVIKELLEKYPRTVSSVSDEYTLKRIITMKEMSFVRTLTEEQKKEFFELTAKYQKLCAFIEQGAFEHGFYISYRLLVDMKMGAKDTYNLLNSLFVD